MIRDRKVIGLACLVATAVLAACGGGGGGGGSSVPSSLAGSSTGPSVVATPTPAVAATATAPSVAAGQALTQFKITLPASTGTTSNARKPQFIEPASKAIALTLLTTNGTAATGSTMLGPYALAAGAPNCSGATVTPVVCTISVAAPVGSDIYLANTYSDTAATQALGSGAVQVVVQANAMNSANLVLTGAVSTVIFTSNNSQNMDTLWNGNGTFVPISQSVFNLVSYQSESKGRRPAGTRAALGSTQAAVPSERVILIAQDSQGNTIFSPTTYNQNIILTLNLNGYTPNATLTDTPPTGLGCTTSSTSVDGGTVAVCSPYDVVTLQIIDTVNSQPYYGCIQLQTTTCNYNINFPTVTAALASTPTTPLATFPFTVEVEPIPSPSPSPTGNLPVTLQSVTVQ